MAGCGAGQQKPLRARTAQPDFMEAGRKRQPERKARQVRRGHECHRDGCHTPVPPKMFMCRVDWFALPQEMRDRICATYRPGQEIDKCPSPEYLEAAREAIDYLGPKIDVGGRA